MDTIINLITTAGAATLRQLIGIFGVFFIFGFLLFILSRLTRNIFHNSDHPKIDLVVTGWIGTPVHELGHALFCVLFRHRITGMKLFSTDHEDGSLGYVTHTYNRKSLYQRTGNLFIGAGPIILGALIIAVLAHYLLPNRQAVESVLSDTAIDRVSASNLFETYPLILSFCFNAFHAVFSPASVSSIGFWTFLYVSLCISSHMGLSPSDLKGMTGGLAMIGLLLFAVNAAAVLMRTDITAYVLKMNHYTARCMSVFILAALISLINFIASYAALGILQYARSGSLVRID